MKLLVIDGNSILNRAYYGIRALTNQKGVYTNAIFGFLNIYLKTISEVAPDCVAVAFDLRSPTFRHKAVASYKANRKGMPEELAMQLPLIKQILTAMGITVVTCEGYEADDILGTLAHACDMQGETGVLLSGDRDNLQLVSESVSVRLATTKETITYTPARFTEEYGFAPRSLIDLKALMGDSSDNISGVAGIGAKTASTLIQQWGTIEALYENLDNAGLAKGAYAKLLAGADAAKESKWLATIVNDAPIPTDISAYRLAPPDAAKLSALLTELELFKLLDKLKLKPAPVAAPPVSASEAPKLTLCRDSEMLTADSLAALLQSGKQTDFLLTDGCLFLLQSNVIYRCTEPDTMYAFFRSDLPKRTFDAKPCYRFAFSAGESLRNVTFDAAIAAYLQNPIAPVYQIERLCDTFGLPYDGGMDKLAEIAALPALCDTLSASLTQSGMQQLLVEIEQPLIEVLAAMEHDGIRVNPDGVRAFGAELTESLESIRAQVYALAGHEFNISSPKQLGVVLFEEIGLPTRKKTKSGYSTNAEVLESLRDKHPIVELILRYRQLAKLSSTYVESLLKTVAPDGRIHTCFKQTETRTGRISSTEPNMQNIPVRTALGREMRKFFIAADGKVLLDADYSQIELRILAHLCGDPHMQEAFRTGFDIHAATAAQVFHMPPELVSPEMRSAAKAVNFGIIYGIGAFSLSKDIGVSVTEADHYIKDYLANFSSVARYMNEIVEAAKQSGHATTMFGRQRPIPELATSNKIQQALGKRIAMNTPIQGTAADIIKIAMIRVYQRLRDEGLQARLILQVHDELIVEATIADAPHAAKILQEEMEGACALSVPLTAEVKQGDSWYAAKG